VGKAFDAHLQRLCLGAAKELESAKEMQQWWRRKDNQLVNSNSPTIPLIKLPAKECGLRRGARSGSPLTGRKNCKITALPTSNGQRPVKITHRVILLMTS
jgi:hypothetical protein